MSNENIHHLPWSSRAERHVQPVNGVNRGVDHGVDETVALPPAGRMVRRRSMSPDEARAIVAGWTRGATPCPVPKGWTAWERVRTDVTGMPRVQRLAVDDREPVTVVNWSVPGRPDSDDEAAWRVAIAPPADTATGSGSDGHEWAA